MQQSGNDGNYKNGPFSVYNRSFTIHDVRPLTLVDSAPGLKANYNASFSVTASFANAPGGSFTVAIEVVSGFNTRMITITPATRTLTDALLSDTFVIAAPFLSPGSFTLRARCVTCAKNISSSDLVINVRELTFIAAQAASSGGFTTLGAPTTVTIFPIGDSSGVNSDVTVAPGASVTASAGPHSVTSASNASLTLTPTAEGSHIVSFTPVSSSQFTNSKFFLPINVFSPWGLRVGSVTPQPMVVGKQYSVGLTAGQMPFGSLVATYDANSTSTGFDRNFTLGVSPRSVSGFSTATLSRIVGVQPQLPFRQFLNFTLAATGTAFVSWATSPSRFWVVPRMNVGINGLPVRMMAGPFNTRVVHIHAGRPPRGVPKVTFNVVVSGTNAANLTTNVSTFERVWGERGTSIPMLLTGLDDANVTITITPSSAEWYVGYSSDMIEVYRLRIVVISDSTTLYGARDMVRVTLIAELLMQSSEETLIANPALNVSSVVELSPALHTFVFEDPDNATKVFNVSALDAYAAPAHGEAVRLS
ncbi:MAG: hypothetical protein Q8J97_02040, partial [Flavobacteriaceae bacterium]|nr:hypothetical protein [Flavobacteriaceae bacterium]